MYACLHTRFFDPFVRTPGAKEMKPNDYSSSRGLRILYFDQYEYEKSIPASKNNSHTHPEGDFIVFFSVWDNLECAKHLLS